jgi:hypothetical protein
MFRQWCSYAGVTLTTTLAQERSAGQAVDGAESVTYRDLYHAQHRYELAAVAVPREPRASESPWPLENLPLIAEAMESLTVSLLRLRRGAREPGWKGAEAIALEYAERLDSIGAGWSRQPPANVETPGELAPLSRSLTRLEFLTGTAE